MGGPNANRPKAMARASGRRSRRLGEPLVRITQEPVIRVPHMAEVYDTEAKWLRGCGDVGKKIHGGLLSATPSTRVAALGELVKFIKGGEGENGNMQHYWAAVNVFTKAAEMDTEVRNDIEKIIANAPFGNDAKAMILRAMQGKKRGKR